MVVTLLFVLALMLPLRLSSDTVRDNEHNNHIYAPVDTAIITFSHPFCEGLILKSPDSEFFIEATLYLLKQIPTLGRLDEGTYYSEARLSQNYQYWHLFLYPGSSVHYSACSVAAIAEPPVLFYLVKGNRGYKEWRSDHSTAYTHREEINAVCDTNDNATFSYTVDDEDNYYFIFDSEAEPMTVTGITFNFSRVLYEVSSSSVVSECSIRLNDSTSCQVPVSLSSEPVAMLELALLAPDSMEWDADVRVDVTCSARVWLYVVIAFSAIAFVGLLVLVAVVVYLCFCRNKEGGSSTPDPPTPDTPQRSEESRLISEKQPNTSYDASKPAAE